MFPPFATFEYDDLHFSIVNFLENERRKISDARLNQYNMEERTKLSKKYKYLLSVLDNLSEEIWGYDVQEKEKWAAILDYISKHFDE